MKRIIFVVLISLFTSLFQSLPAANASAPGIPTFSGASCNTYEATWNFTMASPTVVTGFKYGFTTETANTSAGITFYDFEGTYTQSGSSFTITFKSSDYVKAGKNSGQARPWIKGVNVAAEGLVNSANSGSCPVTLATPSMPTLTSSSSSNGECRIGFTINNNGYPITNFSYSFNNSSYVAFSPAQTTSPLIFTQDLYRAAGLSSNQSASIYVKGINAIGTGPFNSGSSASCSTGNLTQSPTVTGSIAPSGTKSEGETLTSQVTFSGYPTPTKTYKWQRCTSQTELSSCQDISGATAETYVVTSSDVGKYLGTIVVGTSGGTSTTGTSSRTAIITAVADTTPPTVTGVTSTNGTYKAGDVITIVVAMSEAVIVTGTPTLALATTPTSRNATYVSGSGTNSLTFTYTVQATDTAADLNYAATSSLSGTIKDASDNSATLTLPGLTGAGSLGTNQAIVVDTTAPTQTVGSIDISADTGSSDSDFTTTTASQTITATLSAGLGAGETLWASVNGGSTYTDITTTSVSTTAISWAGAILLGSSSIKFQVRDAAGNVGATETQVYVLDATAPTQTVGSIGISADTGSSSSDFTTATESQTITATLSAALGVGESLWGSLNNGGTYTNISASVSTTAVSWASATLSGSSSIKFQVRDSAGNAGTTATQAYVLDVTAPTLTLAASAATSASATITFTVTGNEAISCSTLSTADGTDFTFTGISAITGIVQTSPTVCIITATSTATLGGAAVTSTLTRASSFSTADTAGNAQTTLGGSPASITVTVTDSTAPTLTTPSASSIASTTATLNFTSDEAGTYYYLIYAATDAAPNAGIITAQGTAIAKGTTSALAAANAASATGLSPNTAYKAYVIVKDAATNSSQVSEIAFTTLATVPGTTGTPTAVAGNGQATVTVTAPTTGGTPTSYTVTASPGGATCTVNGASGSCTVTGLTNGTAYTFTSRATNNGGTSASGSVASNSVTPVAPVIVCDAACVAATEAAVEAAAMRAEARAAAAKAAADAAAKAAAEKTAADARVVAEKIASDAASKVVAEKVVADKSAAEAAAKTAVEKATAAAVAKAAADAAAVQAATIAKAAADAQAAAVVAAEKAAEALKSATTSAATKAAATATAAKAATTAANTVQAAASAAKVAATAKATASNASKQVDIALGALNSKTAAATSAAQANAIAAAAKAAANDAAKVAEDQAEAAKVVSNNANQEASAVAARIATEQSEAASAATAAKVATDAALKATEEKIAAATDAQKSAEAVVKVLEEKIALAEASVKAKDITERAAIDKKIQEITVKVAEAQRVADAANARTEATVVAQERAQAAANVAAQQAQVQAAEALAVRAESTAKTEAATKAAAEASLAAKIAAAAKAAAAKVPARAVIAAKPSNSSKKNSATATISGLKPGQKVKVTVNVKGK